MESKHVIGIAALAAAASLTLAGCASELKKAQLNLAEIAELLPGHYSNSAQADADTNAGRDRHEAKAIDIVRIDVPLLSHHAFYVQEESLDDLHRIVSQRLFTFEAAEDGTVVQRLYTFAQPARWRGGQSDPNLFTGMMFKDMNVMKGCDLVWKKEGTRFLAAGNIETCRTSLPSFGSVRTDMKIELSGDELAMAELAYTAGGKLVAGNAADPFFRFERGGQ